MNDDPLAALIVDGAEVDRVALASALMGRVAIDRATGRFVMDDGYDRLDAKRKLLILLLAQKAALLLGLGETDRLAYRDIVRMSGLREGTAAPGLRGLKDDRLADQDANKAYYVPNATLRRAVRLFESEGSR
ncbi:MAG: hypothetical protein E6J42_11175 [Chloroflexi bacterium]|nr:MAG: hypothetical protein E6J42_11175 [Chloroflexota bacterium]